MISYTELQTRLARFVDAEMLPHMTGGKRILLGGYAALATKERCRDVTSGEGQAARCDDRRGERGGRGRGRALFRCKPVHQ